MGSITNTCGGWHESIGRISGRHSIARHDVAIPANQLKQQDGKIVLPGATKEAIKALPKFEYAKK